MRASSQTAAPTKKVKMMGYDVVRLIGDGAYGRVYQARSTSGLDVAIKVQAKCESAARKTLEQIRELHVLRSCSHPNVIQLIGWRETRFDFQLIFPLCDANLHDHVKSGGIPAPDARRFTLHVCRGLEYLHGRNIIHRDLSSKNVLLHGQPVAAAISDFGLAREISTEPLTPDMVTLWYRAPEILALHNKYGTPIDMWSLGLLAVEMELGKPPFRQSSQIGMLWEICFVLGTPAHSVWCGPLLGERGGSVIGNFPGQTQKPWGRKHGPQMCSFAGAVLQVDPEARMTSQAACQHDWLSCGP